MIGPASNGSNLIIRYEDLNRFSVMLHIKVFNFIRCYMCMLSLKEMVKSVFSCGTMVELRVDFAWLPAIIIKELENENRFIVKYYCNKFVSYSEEESRIVTFDSQRVRPSQPSFSVGEYDLLDHVEAFSGFEWRQGVVRGIVFEGRYMVSFGATRAASQFSQSDLRPPMEWEDGVWRKRTKVTISLFQSTLCRFGSLVGHF